MSATISNGARATRWSPTDVTPRPQVTGAAGPARGDRATDAWVLSHRGAKARLDPRRAYAVVAEEECGADGEPAATAAIFLTNRECPFRCVMCDLWVNTLDEALTPGLIPRQIVTALEQVPAARQVKLYNAGSFFDPKAIPVEDDRAIAAAVAGFDRVIVEAHPAFLRGEHGRRCLRWRDLLHAAGHQRGVPGPRLEVAVGLETANRDVLARLNKRMTLDAFAEAASFLREHDIDLRVFILLRPPFMDEAEGVEWACRSLRLAAESGATACSIIPTRGGNGAMEALGADAAPPSLRSLEQVLEYGFVAWRNARLRRCLGQRPLLRLRLFPGTGAAHRSR